MDEIVKQAMAKWPNVPHCYGWLALDARGHWRMRDAATQQAHGAGDRLHHTALIGFINRNYQHDVDGNWYFQNGPQRVYVNLAATPYIARTDPAQGLLLHTGSVLTDVERLFILDDGAPVFQAGALLAQLDDRDVGALFEQLECAGAPVSDDALLAWLAGSTAELQLRWQGALLPVERSSLAALAQRWRFVPTPRAPDQGCAI